ncbi:ribosome biosynthesis protein [Saccharomycopsis crataegensis]|uniref:Ribosome biogenesis protein NSA1 n=1 Tax=Saccharomycopsis crataegensis TaxID=43959 RepID=A0AAV5QSI2_9ASCO|nr:ribosome biosynthesis protein [Saccharomycopsis crataegensis]
MRLLVAVDDKSSFKEIVCEHGTDTSKQTGIQPISITSYKYGGEKSDRIAKIISFTHGSHKLLAIVRNNYTVQILKLTSTSTVNNYTVVKSIPLEPGNDTTKSGEAPSYETKFVALNIHHDEFLYAATQSGDAYFISLDDIVEGIPSEVDQEEIEEHEKEYQEKAEARDKKFEESIAARKKDPKKLVEPKKPIKITRNIPEILFDNDVPVIQVNLKRTRVHAFVDSTANFGIFAYGGENEDLRIISVATELSDHKQKQLKGKSKSKSLKLSQPLVLYEAKNVKHDRLDLRVPVWVSNIVFFNEETNKLDHTPTPDEFKSQTVKLELLTTTYYGEIRKYDTSHGRKPVSNQIAFPAPHNTPNKKPKILTMGIGKTGVQDDAIVISDDHNSVIKYNIVKNRSLGKLVGAQGATQSIYCTMDVVVTGGLDKYVRVFEREDREQIAKVFVKSRISCVYLVEEDHEENDKKRSLEEDDEQDHSNEEEDDGADDLWDQLEEEDESQLKVKPKKKKARK